MPDDPDLVALDDKLLIVTRNGISIRIEVEGIREAGRSTQGVKLIYPQHEGARVTA